MFTIRDNMIAEAETNAAFSDLEALLARDEEAPYIENDDHLDADQKEDGDLEELLPWEEFDEKMQMEFYDEADGVLQWDEKNYHLAAFKVPDDASLDIVVVNTDASHTGEAKIWLAGNGYLRMQMEMWRRDAEPIQIIWSGIQRSVDRKRRKLQEVKDLPHWQMTLPDGESYSYNQPPSPPRKYNSDGRLVGREEWERVEYDTNGERIYYDSDGNVKEYDSTERR
ncbi:hypothetical protein BU23DRAFT_572247 [Bimuria novae-zelandiae CBS 107.79]|uniref:Uncharacterized protein n=1 Tax=Bimuria novae-zelandiae CBS 107.79 TaxID=1447943 RepID=A0A6A5UXX8_9PLEO|nr:hypothetical protein BU23DRAFT_572247 [Bimuria novae-zelandiae CBS 107.79]